MKPTTIPAVLIIIGILFVLDWYVYNALQTIILKNKTSYFFFRKLYWIVSLLIVTIFLFSFFLTKYNYTYPNLRISSLLYSICIAFFIAKILATVFFIIDDVRRAFTWLSLKLFSSNTYNIESPLLSRSAFLTWLGTALGSIFLFVFLKGFGNKYNYKVQRVTLHFDNLPASFRGFKLVQISDIHSGSFTNKNAVRKGVDMILNENADLILFTGDLVNNQHGEMKEYMDVFSRLHAPYGVYSTLGNHDYGDYAKWDSPDAKQENLEALKNIHAQLGWHLLMNENVVLEKGNKKIALIGVENWSAHKRFPRHGDLAKAAIGTEKIPFSILMSHDPSHWDAVVRPQFPRINLMLAGHTHGMQFGIENPYFKWSPVQMMYKQWAGLYEEGKQKLYVNRGFGFLGYPGRVGIMPEITVIELV